MSSSCRVCSLEPFLSGLEEKEAAISQEPFSIDSTSFAGRMWRKIRSLIPMSNSVSKIKEELPPDQIRALRPIVENFLAKKESDKIAGLLPFFSLLSLPKASCRLKDSDVVTIYCKIHALAVHVFTALPKAERGVLGGVQAEEIAQSPDLFLTLLQTSYDHAIGCLSKEGDGGAASLVERGVLMRNILPLHLPFKFPEALLVSRASLACVPKEISAFFRTKILDLSENALHCLTGKIGALKDLRQLNLSKNNLHALPPEIEELQCLAMIDLSFNPLEKFPKELRKLAKLQVITLDENQAKKFSRAISRFLAQRKDCQIRKVKHS